MADTDQKREDDLLRRLLATKPTPQKPKASDERAIAKKAAARC